MSDLPTAFELIAGYLKATPTHDQWGSASSFE